jgi:oligopeptide transport system ATP-binding protein
MLKKSNPILEVKDLQISFQTNKGTLYAVDKLSYTLGEGEVLGIVGESGSGKTVNATSMIGLLQGKGMEIKGSAKFFDEDLLSLLPRQLARLRGKDIGFVFQNPLSSLNPVMTVGKQIAEGAVHHGVIPKSKAKEYAINWLNKVGIYNAETRYKDYPHQFSGGMRQRVMIAIAMACKPKLLICDEPTTALDVTVERQILDLLKEMQAEYKLSIIMITHNLSIALDFSDDLLVMYGGKAMEYGSAYDLASNPQHPYTKGLFAANLEVGKKGQAIGGIREVGSDLEVMEDGSYIVAHGEKYQERGQLREHQPGHLYNNLYLK